MMSEYARAGRELPNAPIQRGTLLAILGGDRLEAILYERDELRGREAEANTCDPCLADDHEHCSGGPIAPGCSCQDCELGIPDAAQDPLPEQLRVELVGAKEGTR